MDMRFSPKPEAPGVYRVAVDVQGEDGGWAVCGELVLTEEEWGELRSAILIGGAGRFGIHLEVPETWATTL